MGHSAPKIAVLDGIADAIASTLGDRLIETIDAHDELGFLVRREAVAEVLDMLREHHEYQQLVEIAGVDYPERAERFEVCYHLLSLTRNHRIRVKCRTDEATPVPTVTHIWEVAGWLEREVYDMYGVLFAGNTDLRRILTDYGFKGHPFRKDFPLTGYHELRYSEEQGRVVYEPVKLAQDFRSFDFMSPWEGADYVLPGDEKAEPEAPKVDKPVTTDKKSDTGAGEGSGKEAAKQQSNGSPAQEDKGKAPSAPDKTAPAKSGKKGQE
ncbi:MAG: NADH-quinone oxidoreductase subunit C [Blastomonas sp.]